MSSLCVLMPAACFKHVKTRGKGLGTLQKAYKHLFGTFTRDHNVGEYAISGISKDIKLFFLMFFPSHLRVNNSAYTLISHVHRLTSLNTALVYPEP